MRRAGKRGPVMWAYSGVSWLTAVKWLVVGVGAGLMVAWVLVKVF